MPSKRIQPDSLMKARRYSHVVVAEGARTVYVAGQVATDATGELIGGDDLVAQTRQVYQNLKSALEAAGAGFEHLVKITTYVVGYKPEHSNAIGAVRMEFCGDAPLPAATLVGVAALGDPAWLIELEAIAVV